MKSSKSCRRVTFALFAVSSLVSLAQAPAPVDGDALAQGFESPPASAKPQTWWHWMNGNVTKEGVTADLEAMKAVGEGGATIVTADLGTPAMVQPQLKYMTPEWLEMVRYTLLEAKRLGLEITIEDCAGWSESGGPWVKPATSMQKLVWSETLLGPVRLVPGVILPIHPK